VVDLRRRSEAGDDVVLKLTEAGARYGVARGKARVALRYRLDPDAFDELYATLRAEAFDRIETEPVETAPTSGTSLRITAGPGRYSASAMGRRKPTEAYAEAYDRCVRAAESLLPADRSSTVVTVRWHASMADRSASIDIDIGEDFVGLVRLPGELPEVELHLARPRELELLLRHGSPPRSSTHHVRAGKELGIEIRYDAEHDRVIARPLAEDGGA